MLTPVISLFSSGPTLTERNDLAAGAALLGRPNWNATQLLSQLELRLGLPRVEMADVLRVQRWSARLNGPAEHGDRFYAASYATDRLGTARTLLEWRDELVMAGWNGEAVPGGGSRLDTLSELERGAGMSEIAPGFPDRLLRVVRELETEGARVFDGIELLQDRELWTALWQRVFAQLEACGVSVRTASPTLPARLPEGDLGRVQAVLLGQQNGPVELAGDGTFVWLEAETAWELGQACAALLHAEGSPSSLVIRGGDAAALDAGLALRGLPSQGVSSRSAWRPALCVLSLALELAFEPRNPARVFELVTLPEGPFRGRVGYELAKALADAPGIGGRPWQGAKQRLRDAGVEQRVVDGIREWLEGDTYDPLRGAPTSALREISGRTREWLSTELTRAHAAVPDGRIDRHVAQRIELLCIALVQVKAFQEALEQDDRAALRLTEVRQLLDETCGTPAALELVPESAGRIDHVAHPDGARAPRDVVLWWYCAAGTEWRARPSPWRSREIAALAGWGVRLADLRARLAAEAESWFAPVLAARQRFILASPRSALGSELAPHPLMSELAARLPRATLEPVRVHARDWLNGDATRQGRLLERYAGAVVEVGPAPLPPARTEWVLDPARSPSLASLSASSVEALVSCPLKWVLRDGAGLNPGSNRAIPSGPLLNGKLGHRLIEEVQSAGALSEPERASECARTVFERLVSEEAGVLLCSGNGSELTQLRAQLCSAVSCLSTLIAASELEVVGVEVDSRASCGGRELRGRIDLLLRDQRGEEVVLDLKWGSSRYADLLQNGTALQLAVYTELRKQIQGSGRQPRAGYFCLANAKLLATEATGLGDGEALSGPTLSVTWQRLHSTLNLVEALLGSGRVIVTGLTRSLPLASHCEQPGGDPGNILAFENGAACTYCEYGAVCGRSWEAYA